MRILKSNIYKISEDLLKHFKGYSSCPNIIMTFVYFKARFSLSYRDIEEISIMFGSKIDHSTFQRWVDKFSFIIDQKVRKHKKPVNGSWRMDETYVRFNGIWIYLYRAVDSNGDTIDFLLKKNRDKSAAKAFFKKAIINNNIPIKINIDKSGSNIYALKDISKDLPKDNQIEIRQNKYLNNRIEQDHRFIKKRIKTCLGFKNFDSASNTISSIENIRIIQKNQLTISNENKSTYENFIKVLA
jgi:putative transposase